MAKKLVYEVSIIRPLVIFLLVVTHSFAYNTGSWPDVEGIQKYNAYFWMVKLISGFRIETIAMVAGYIFSFQVNDLDRKYELKPFVSKKFMRLILPCWFFGVFYYFFFLHQTDDTFFAAIKIVTSGAGHLWFLPMLFWSFSLVWCIDHFKLNKIFVFIGLSILSILPPFSLPLGFGRVNHFLFYFYGGYVLWLYKDYVREKLMNTKGIVLLVIAYLSIVVFYNMFHGYGEGMVHDIVAVVLRVLRYFNIMAGILSLWCITSIFTTKEDFVPKDWILDSSKICYGVYVYHQFFLRYLYYYSPFPEFVYNSVIFPWIGLAITLLVSIILAKLTLKTKFGRFLIG